MTVRRTILTPEELAEEARIAKAKATKAARRAVNPESQRQIELEKRRRREARSPEVPNPWDLSPQEIAVLRAMIDLGVPSAVASRLSLSVKTVSTYMTRVKEKMGFPNYFLCAWRWYAFEHRCIDGGPPQLVYEKIVMALDMLARAQDSFNQRLLQAAEETLRSALPASPETVAKEGESDDKS